MKLIKRIYRLFYSKLIKLFPIIETRKFIKRKEVLNAKALEKASAQGQYEVCFFMLTTSTWKYHSLYLEMFNNEKFNPVVVVIPLSTRGAEVLNQELESCNKYCKKNDYNYLVPQNSDNNWYEIKDVIKPSLVFFSNPNALTNPFYQIDNFKEVLTCYLPYSIRIDNLSEYSYNAPFSNAVWRNYYETSLHLRIAKKYSKIKARNVKVSGHPIIDQIRNEDPLNHSVWKEQSKDKKRIIWAPHWTIKGFQNSTLDWSSFLNYSSFMIELANKYFGSIQISFKPHPFLKSTLESEQLWGKEKTDLYYKEWEELENGQVDSVDYISLFKQSDALIHDSGSFSVEYLELNKPVLYAKSREDVENTFNDLGNEAIQSHYIASNRNEIEYFIKNVVISGNDEMKTKRKEFRNKFLKPTQNSSSEFIVNDLMSVLKRNK